MIQNRMRLAGCVAALSLSWLMTAAEAGGGYFVLGYGPYAAQSAGTSTAVGLDTFSGASNPAKLSAVGDRVDLGVLLFSPYRRVERSGSGTPYDFETTSRNELYFLPDGGYARRINEKWSWGVSVYGNGGLNTEYPGTTGVAGTSANPAACGSRPGNFFGGCGAAGFDLSQIIGAPTLSYAFTPQHSVGVAALLGLQQFRAYGLQAFQPLSQTPDAVTGNGTDRALGAGVRIGWFGRMLPWLDLGAAYSSPIYMQKLDKYRGLLADRGSFDIPANFSIGAALKGHDLTLGLDVQRIMFGQIRVLNNGVLNTLQDPVNNPLGSKTSSGFHWSNQTNVRLSLAWHATPTLDLRAGVAYGKVAQQDHSANTATLTMLVPNPDVNVTAGFSYAWNPQTELNMAYGRYLGANYSGDSALFPGATEKLTAHVDTLYLGWSRRF